MQGPTKTNDRTEQQKDKSESTIDILITLKEGKDEMK